MSYGKEYYLANRDKIRESRRLHYQENKTKIAEVNRDYRERNKDKIRERKTLSKYGLTIAAYQELLELQNDVCAICGGTETDKRLRALPVDHDHKTGKVRGLLCSPCNQGIGMFYENIETMKKAIAYLENSK